MRFRFVGGTEVPDYILAEIATLSRISAVRMKLLVKEVLRHIGTGRIDADKVLKLTSDALHVEEDGGRYVRSGAAGAGGRRARPGGAPGGSGHACRLPGTANGLGLPSRGAPLCLPCALRSDLRGAVAALDFILRTSASHDIDDATLLQEVQQLGLPKENSEALSRQYRVAKDGLRERLQLQSYRVNRLVGLDWRVDYVLASDASGAEDGSGGFEGPTVHLKFSLDQRPFEGHGDGVRAAEGGGLAADGDRVVEAAMEVPLGRFDVLCHELRQAREMVRSLES